MVVDASVWVGLLVPGDTHHAVCRAWISRELAAATGLVIPAYALAEVAGAIARRTGCPADGRRSAATVPGTPRLQIVPIDAGLADATADHLLRAADAV